MKRQLKSRQTAFTYVDIVIVLLTVGILSAVALPRFNAALDAYRVEGATRCVVHDLALARTLARRQSQETVIEFSTESPTYRIINASHPDRPHETHQVDLSAAGFRVAFTNVSFDGFTQLAFDLHGEPYAVDASGVRSPLQNGQITIAAGQSSRTLQVEPLTGTVR